jgi:hypothetical protein
LCKAREKKAYHIVNYAFLSRLSTYTDIFSARYGVKYFLFVFCNLGAVLARAKKLEPWILVMRKEREDRTFGEHFQKLYEKTVAYMKRV